MASKRICVLKCAESKHMHAFPRDEVGKSVWLKQLGLKSATATSYVCDLHFSEKMKPQGVGVKLTPWAIPDVNLPVRGDSDTDEDDFYEDEPYYSEIITSDEAQLDTATTNSYAHTNGYAISEANSESETNNVQTVRTTEPLDFDDVLAKVHYISNVKPCTSKPENSNTTSTSIGINCDRRDEVSNNAYELRYNEQYTESLMNDNNMDADMLIEEDAFSAPTLPIEIDSKFKRKLIASVRKRRVLYDPAHPGFSNIERKTRAWERIGKLQKLSATSCRELWLNMRYEYQNHVRNLRQWLSGDSDRRERPRIPFENDLLFLWRYVADKSFCDDSDDDTRHPRSIVSHIPDIPDAPSFSSRHVSAIVSDYARSVDHPYANKNVDEPVKFPFNLIEAIKHYSELYDTQHPNYGNPKRKSIIWDAISNELSEKATKCLYTWIQLQLRYEFEIKHNKSSYLINKMDFLKKYILNNEKSIFKRVSSHTDEWHEPMNGYTEQHQIIQTLVASKKYRTYFYNIDNPMAIEKNPQFPCWMFVGKAIKRRAEQCELTWLVMQAMYCEILEFRQNDCLLSDEWEFDIIITNLLANLPSKNIKRIVREAPTPPAAYENDISFVDCENIADPPLLAKKVTNQEKEITFTIPSSGSGEPSKDEPLIRYSLDVPVKELPEKSVVEIDSVCKDAHIVILTRYRRAPAVFPFTLEKRQELIGEVMARPLIYNEACKHSRLARIFWGEISTEILYPAEICMFFWEFLRGKMLFTDYDPKWKRNPEEKWIPPPNPIFDKFQKYADSRNWREYISSLPDFIQEISNFPLIYVDLKINSTWNRRQCHARDIAEVWSILARKFAVLENHKVIWDKFKQVFLMYMSEMELSIYNEWPDFWFPVLEKLKFLFELRYDPKDPIYYIIRIKIQEEINKRKGTSTSARAKLDSVTNGKAIFGLLKEKEYLQDFKWVNRARFLAKMKSYPMLFDISHPLFGNKQAKSEAWQEMALSFHCTVGECHLIFQHMMKSFLIFRVRDPIQLCHVNSKYWENMTYIYSCAVPNSVNPNQLESRSFREASTGSTIKLAEEYQAEISLVDAKPRLILKNFAAAVNSLPAQIQSPVVQQMKQIFAKYERMHTEDIVVDV